MSVEEYLELDRNSVDARYEYIDGVVTMLAGGTTNHSRISVNVVSLLRGALRGSPCEVFNSDLRVSISSTRYVLPDASVSCVAGDLEGENDTISSPRVIVEVLSPSTEATDRGKKFRYYQSCLSIHEYVLISTQEQAVDVYRRASDNLWTLHPFGPGDEVELKSIDVSILLEALYENVTVLTDSQCPDESASAGRLSTIPFSSMCSSTRISRRASSVMKRCGVKAASGAITPALSSS